MLRLGGQLRLAPPVVIGWDMTAALAMARAMGVSPRLAADLLPHVEAAMTAKMNEQIKVDDT